MSNGTPRRRSIFGGVLFVAIGALLLMANLNPEIRIWRWLADYWPVLLILWGLSKLFDYFAARRLGDSAPRSLTGGEVFLVILIVMIGIGVSGTRHFMSENPDIWEEFEGVGNSYSYEDQLTQPFKPGSQLSVNTDRGDITIVPVDGQEIRVLVKKTARAFESAEAARRAQSVSVTLQAVSGGYEIIPRVNSDSQRGVRVDLEVQVPKKAAVRAKTERGNVQITGIEGPVTVTNTRGNVELRNITGEVTAEMRRGDVRISEVKGPVRITGRGSEVDVSDVSAEASIQGEFYGPIRVSNVAKEVHFLSQKSDITISQLPGRMELGGGNTEIYDTPGNVSITTREKDVTLENIGGRIRVTNRRGEVSIRLRETPKEPMEIDNESAGVELSLPGKSAFELSAKSRNGQIESDFEGPDLKQTSDEKNESLEGKVGAKGPKIQLRTTYGSVRIRKID